MSEEVQTGLIRISDDVVSTIAGLAALLWVVGWLA